MRIRELIIVGLLVAIGILVLNDVSYASSAGDLPYEKGLLKLVDSITGPVAAAIGVLAVFAAASMMMFGSDLSGVVKALVIVCITIGVGMSGAKLLSFLFGSSGNMVVVEEVTILSDKIVKPDIGFIYEQDI